MNFFPIFCSSIKRLDFCVNPLIGALYYQYIFTIGSRSYNAAQTRYAPHTAPFVPSVGISSSNTQNAPKNAHKRPYAYVSILPLVSPHKYRAYVGI